MSCVLYPLAYPLEEIARLVMQTCELLLGKGNYSRRLFGIKDTLRA